VSVIRAFSYFSHLANIAEDRHHVRRREHHEREGHLQEGSLAWLRAPAPADHRAADIAQTLQQAYIAPVLTAHPTEVQRKSILDAERAMAELIGERDDWPHRASARRQRGADARPRHPAVADAHAALLQADGGRRDRERAELLPATFLREIPRCTARSRTCPARARGAVVPAHGPLDRRRPRRQPQRHADTLRHALARQSEVALRFYLTEVHALGAELSMSLHAGRRDAARCRRWPTQRPTTTRTARTSPTAAP
jgi:phosphoenolpyruvate carboxylase